MSVEQFCNMFNNLFDEFFLISILYKYYKSYLITICHDKIHIIDNKTNEILKVIKTHLTYIHTIVVNDNKIIVSDSFGVIKIYDMKTSEQLKTVYGYKSNFVVYNDKLICRNNTGTIHILDIDDLEIKHTLIDYMADILCFSKLLQYENKVLSYQYSKTIKIWNITTYEYSTIETKHVVIDIAVLNDVVYVASKSSEIAMYDIKSGHFYGYMSGHTYNTSSMITHDNYLIIITNDVIKIMDIETGICLRIIYEEANALLAHGRYLYVNRKRNNMIKINIDDKNEDIIVVADKVSSFLII